MYNFRAHIHPLWPLSFFFIFLFLFYKISFFLFLCLYFTFAADPYCLSTFLLFFLRNSRKLNKNYFPSYIFSEKEERYKDEKEYMTYNFRSHMHPFSSFSFYIFLSVCSLFIFFLPFSLFLFLSLSLCWSLFFIQLRLILSSGCSLLLTVSHTHSESSSSLPGNVGWTWLARTSFFRLLASEVSRTIDQSSHAPDMQYVDALD